MVDMNDIMIAAPSDASEVIDLCDAPLSELPAGLAAEAMVDRFVHEECKPRAYAVGAFNSYI
jgi:hypothetical protein